MTDPEQPRRRTPSLPSAARLLPAALLQVPIARLALPEATATLLLQHDVATVHDLLSLPARTYSRNSWFAVAHVEAVQRALAQLLREGLATCDPTATRDAFRDLRDELLGCLSDDERLLVTDLVGFDAPPLSRLDAALQRALPVHVLEERTEQARARLHQTAPALLGRLRYEVGRDLAAGGGMLADGPEDNGSLLQVIAEGSRDPLLGARLVAFCFPREFSLHREALCGVAPRTLRRLLRELPRLVPPQRLPLPVATLEEELAAVQAPAPRGLLVHLLRIELRVEIGPDADGVLVVIHDDTVDHTTDGSGHIQHMTFAEVRELDAGGWFGEQFKGTRIPVRTIAAMLAQGADEEDLLNGYPSLTARMLELAKIWTAAHPTRGRPKKLSDQGLKVTSSKRATLKGDPRPSMRKARVPA